VSVNFKVNFPAPHRPPPRVNCHGKRRMHFLERNFVTPPITELSNRSQRSSGTNASLAIAGGILQINGHVSFRNLGVEKLLDTFSIVTERLSKVNGCVASNNRLH
jgi:hypothetical protein